jgi:hypothetical protein
MVFMKRSAISVLMLMVLIGQPMFVSAEQAEDVSEEISGITGEQAVVTAVPAEKPAPDPGKVKQLMEHFDSLQDKPQYYGDPKFRKKMKRHEYTPLIKYKPNFGKKVWVKGWKLKDIEKKMELFGEKNRIREFRLSALEVAEEVAPFIKDRLKDSEIDFEYWAERFEEFGRTYVNPSKAGKKKTYFQVADYQNGNFLVVQATKPFKRKMAYFISEDHDLIIKALLDFKEDDGEKETGKQK